MATVRAPAAYSAGQLYRRTSTNERVVAILKLTHPTRQQRVVVVPCPRIALNSFYVDWAYQPYVKEHQLLLSFDIFSPLFAFGARSVIDRNKDSYEGIKTFSAMRIPGPAEQDVTRGIVAKRTHVMRPWVVQQIFTTARFRDRHHKYVRHAVLRLVGESYLNHPARESDGSFVFLLPPAQAATALRALDELGFEVSDSTDAPAGNADSIGRLERYSSIGEAGVLLYLYINIILVISAVYSFVAERMDTFKAEYYKDRPQKIEQLYDEGLLTREEADDLLRKERA